MALRQQHPTSAGRRFQSVADFTEISKKSPERSLLAPLHKSGGRNNRGRVTSFQRGGGHKRRYRLIDFRREKDGIAAKVAAIEYDPNRSARIALLHYVDGEKRYILAPVGLNVGDAVEAGPKSDIKPGNSLALSLIPLGFMVHNCEVRERRGVHIGRSEGTAMQL